MARRFRMLRLTFYLYFVITAHDGHHPIYEASCRSSLLIGSSSFLLISSKYRRSVQAPIRVPERSHTDPDSVLDRSPRSPPRPTFHPTQYRPSETAPRAAVCVFRLKRPKAVLARACTRSRSRAFNPDGAPVPVVADACYVPWPGG